MLCCLCVDVAVSSVSLDNMCSAFCNTSLDVRRVSDTVMAIVLVFEEDVLRLICEYAPQSGRSLEEKQSLCDEWVMHCIDNSVVCLGDFNDHVCGHIHGGYCIALLEFYLDDELCVSSTWCKGEDKWKVTFILGENEVEIDFVLCERRAQSACTICESNPREDW